MGQVEERFAAGVAAYKAGEPRIEIFEPDPDFRAVYDELKTKMGWRD